MRTFKVSIRQAGAPVRSISVIAKCSIDALLTVRRAMNEHQPSWLSVRVV